MDSFTSSVICLLMAFLLSSCMVSFIGKAQCSGDSEAFKLLCAVDEIKIVVKATEST